MSSPAPRKASASRNVLIGIMRVARFDAAGLAQFTASPQAFLNSLAPLIAFPLVGGALLALSGSPVAALGDFLSSVVALLAPAVLSHLLARFWGREALWLRYAVAFNWCQWAVPLMAIGVMVSMLLMVMLGVPRSTVAVAGVGGMVLYALALHWFLASRALQLSGMRAFGMVLFTNIGTAMLVLVPRIFAMDVR